PFADPQLLAAGKPLDIAVHDSTDAPGKPPDRRMRLFNQFLRSNVAQRAVQRLVDACKRVKQDIVRDHEGVLRSLRLLQIESEVQNVQVVQSLRSVQIV